MQLAAAASAKVLNRQRQRMRRLEHRILAQAASKDRDQRLQHEARTLAQAALRTVQQFVVSAAE